MLNKLKKVKDLTKRVRKSKDGKVLVENFAYLTLLQVAGYIFPLITLPYLARVIGVDSFGKIAFAAAIIGWFQTVADWGFNYTATRDVAKNREDKEKVSQIFSNVLWARVFLMLVSFVALSICVMTIPKLRENADVIMISFLMIPGHIMFPDWFFQAMERMKYITILNIISKTLFTIAVFLFIKEKQDYLLQPLFTSLGFVVSGIIAMYYILVKWKIRLRFTPFKEIIKTIKSSTDVFINNIVPNLYNAFSSILLGFVGGDVANGILDAGRKFITIMIQMIKTLSRVFFPFLVRKSNNHNLYSKIMLMFSMILSVGIFVFAPTLMNIFFTKEFYEGGVLVMRIMSFYVFAISVNDVYGINYMIIKKKEAELRNITFITAIVGFITAIILIPKFGFIGAALAITFSGSLRALIIYLYVKLKIN
jgi:PST family polysaccharide transporter